MTPRDHEGSDLSASLARVLEHETQRLDGLAQPALLLDAGRARVLAANSGGLALLGLPTLPPGGAALDRAMPAISALSAHVTMSGPRALVFWTPAGPRTINVLIDPVPALGRATFKLVAIDTEGVAEVAAKPAVADEVDTMAIIARRIREGLGGGLLPADPKPVIFPATPPAGVEKSARAAEEATGPAPAQEELPGLRLMSERDLATLAHELRTPLAAIMALAEAMRDEHFGPLGSSRYIEYAADIHLSADHALKVLQSLVEASAPSTTVGRTDANDLIVACLSALGPLAERAGVVLRPALASGLPPVLADARALRQIILNLVTNALKHTPRGGEITVTTAYRVDGPVRLEVRDNGHGITAEDLRAIEAEIEADRNGLPPSSPVGGLGLPLVRRMAAANGAEFGIDSRPGQGTRVFLTFDRARVADSSTP